MNFSKEELLANISDLFLTYGLRSTSMEDICNYLKISKKTLYHIFENKDDVVEQVMLYRLESIRKRTTPKKISENRTGSGGIRHKEAYYRKLE